MDKICCPHCGGHLSYETFGQYGLIHKVGYNGQVQKRVERVDYGGDDVVSELVYCRSCHKDFKFEMDGDTIVSVKEKYYHYD